MDDRQTARIGDLFDFPGDPRGACLSTMALRPTICGLVRASSQSQTNEERNRCQISGNAWQIRAKPAKTGFAEAIRAKLPGFQDDAPPNPRAASASHAWRGSTDNRIGQENQ
jgi:hypothetical protein